MERPVPPRGASVGTKLSSAARSTAEAYVGSVVAAVDLGACHVGTSFSCPPLRALVNLTGSLRSAALNLDN
jgi:hypothetical protein